MEHKLPDPPYSYDALEPHISSETLELHHGRHHAAYVRKLNELVRGTGFEQMSLENIIRRSSNGIFNNAAQIWNHTFYWQCLTPHGGGEPKGALADAIGAQWGSVENFRKRFVDAALGTFGSGWVWLVHGPNGSLQIVPAGNAGNPLTHAGWTALLTCDVWEHAYYVDYRDRRAEYLAAFWNLVNWEFVAWNLAEAEGRR